MVLEVTDDAGDLAVVVPAAYEGFVDSDWQLDHLLGHFRAQMARRSLLIWGTGREGVWRVDVRLRRSRTRGFREASGPLRVVGGAARVTNYESLTRREARTGRGRLRRPRRRSPAGAGVDRLCEPGVAAGSECISGEADLPPPAAEAARRRPRGIMAGSSGKVISTV